MYLIKVVKKKTIIFILSSVFFVIVLALFFLTEHVPAISDSSEQWEQTITELFDTRNRCVLNGDLESLKKLFLIDERNGKWAYENEARRSRYLESWCQKQGANVLNIESTFVIKSIKQVGRGYAFYIVASNEYAYAYDNEPDTINVFRLGTYHSLDLIKDGEDWIISREWYDDPLSGVMSVQDEEITAHILSQTLPDLSAISEQRLGAAQYADRYCGAASDGQNGYKYNEAYTNYNDLGGDCANFASQILHEGAGFKKNGAWNYKDGKGSRSWINAQGFKDYLLYNGKGSLLSKGKYKDVYKHAYKLLPGDVVAYAKKGKVTHVSVVTGLDSKGYPLVNCHNSDRYRVPFDIGWSSDNISFYLISVHY